MTASRGTAQWSNHPRGRSDGTMMPAARGVITTPEGAEVMFELSGRTVFVTQGTETVGRQLLMTLFESEDDRYRWLNDTVCMTEGRIDPVAMVMHMEVAICRPGRPDRDPATSLGFRVWKTPTARS